MSSISKYHSIPQSLYITPKDALVNQSSLLIRKMEKINLCRSKQFKYFGHCSVRPVRMEEE